MRTTSTSLTLTDNVIGTHGRSAVRRRPPAGLPRKLPRKLPHTPTLWLTRAVSVIAAWAATVVVCGCAPMAEQVDTMGAEGRYDEAVAAGRAWLERNERVAEPAEVARVDQAVARAAIAGAAVNDRVEDWQRARKQVRLTDATAGLVDEMKAREAAAWYRDIALPSGRPEAHQQFRARYPRSPLVRNSEREEVRLAFEAAREVGTVVAWTAFRARYGRVAHARGLIEEAKALEADAAYRDAAAQNTAAAWSSFCSRYPDSPLVARALRAELAVAFAEARAAGTNEALRRFAQTYASYPDAAGHITVARRLEVERAHAAAVRDGSDAQLAAFLKAYETWPEAAAEAAAVRDTLLKMRLHRAVDARDQAELERFLMLHREWPNAEAALRAGRRELVLLAFAEAERGASRALWRRFLERFEGWAEAERELTIARARAY